MRRILDRPEHPQDQLHLPLAQREQLFTHHIRVENLSYCYPGSDVAAQKNVSFEIKPGQTVGILGKVGAGKTTLVNCLNRYLDIEAGSVFIDNEDITELSRRDLRSAVRTITQDPFLFSDTVSENIQFGSAGLEDPLPLEQVLYQSDMLDEVQLFPEREETLVGEKGILLSGGQKQRLSLSRGLYTPCKLIILDNVLSAVDNETERFLLDQIFDNSRSSATLIISHRATVLEKVDLILVMSQGELVAQGTHEELLQRSPEYRQTWQLQQHDSGASL
jgi:ATP-binding cassette subfamily B multidrug efflux pump